MIKIGTPVSSRNGYDAAFARVKDMGFTCCEIHGSPLMMTEKEINDIIDAKNKYGEGVHHIAFVINGMKEKIEICQRNGMPLLQKGEYTGGRYAYIDAKDSLKTIIELLEND